MAKPNRDAMTIKFDTELRKQAEAEIEESGMTKAEFFETAVREYLQQDRWATVEEMVRDIHEETVGEGDASDSENEKKKKSGECTDTEDSAPDNLDEYDETDDEYLKHGPLPIDNNQRDGKANRMVNYILLGRDGDDRFNQSEITEAITTIGSNSDYYKETYTPLVEGRLRDEGWHFVPILEMWVHGEDNYANLISERWENSAKPTLIDGDGLGADSYDEAIEQMNQLLELAEEGQDILIERDEVSEEMINRAIQSGEKRLEALKRKKKNREGKGGGA